MLGVWGFFYFLGCGILFLEQLMTNYSKYRDYVHLWIKFFVMCIGDNVNQTIYSGVP